MASDDLKDDKEALNALESEAYEFDKVNNPDARDESCLRNANAGLPGCGN